MKLHWLAGGVMAACTLVPISFAAEPARPAPMAREAFDRIKALAGVWEGNAVRPDGMPATVTYELVSSGTAVLERMFAGTPHEMLNLYHLDGSDLMAVHYCSAGNQPRMKYDPAASSAAELAFDFVGGSNMDASRDAHVHGGRLYLLDGARMEEEWIFWKDGKLRDKAKFFLRKKASR